MNADVLALETMMRMMRRLHQADHADRAHGLAHLADHIEEHRGIVGAAEARGMRADVASLDETMRRMEAALDGHLRSL